MPRGDGERAARCNAAGGSLTFGWMPIGELLIDGFDLMAERHWREVGLDQGRVPLKPDWPRYQKLEEAGILRCWAARDGHALAGYIFWFVQPHIHYSATQHAFCDIYYLDPAWRRGWTAYCMFKSSLDRLKADFGVEKAYLFEKLHLPTRAGMFKRLGFQPIETTYSALL